MENDPLRPILERMERSEIATPAQLVGCSGAEIAALEARYGIRLPRTYRRFLEAMGHDAGRLFRHDHYSGRYRDALVLTAEHREHAEDPKECPLVLPDDALVIGERQGDVYDFIRCSGPDDSPVWQFTIDKWEPRESFPSVLA